MKEIPLTQGKFALVDDEDYEKLSKLKWCVSRNRNDIYAVTKGIRMHRFILGLTDPRVMVDHRNHNGLDNRKANLRTCTHSQNQGNSRVMKNNTSGCRGVGWSKSHNRWYARIQFQGKRKRLGLFKTKEEATAIWTSTFKQLFKDFA